MLEPWWFTFNGIDSRTMGVHVIKYPPIVMPPERLKYITVPGRSGDLTQTEGPAIYDPYTKVMEISNMKGFDLDQVTKWLRGRGTMIFGNEPKYAYTVDLGAKCQLDKIIRGVWGGDLQIRCQPFKQLAIPEPDIRLTADATIFNPGDVPAYPLITFSGVSGTKAMTVRIQNVRLYYSAIANNYKADYELQWLLNTSGQPQANVTEGQYYPFQPGNNTFTATWANVTTVIIKPRWRYL